jgi:hypothetical protein
MASLSERPIGTYGPVGASTTIYATSWSCGDCKQSNLPDRTACKRCKAARPAEALEGCAGGSANTQQVDVSHKWREVLDPASNQMYYYNLDTNETSWDRPEVMGPAPYATGWFGRGTSDSTSKYDENNAKYLARPARKQKEFVEASKTSREGDQGYNIWYGKYRGENWNESDLGQEPAENRCVVETDAGATAADSKGGNGHRFFCIQFCRGKCARGSKCTWFHRIPTVADDGLAEQMHDCFGRERHKTHKDDMSGAGSYESPSRTLYVGRLRPDKWDAAELKKALKQQFGEFGQVEHVNVISAKNIAFVRYRFRSSAEFGKEAMANQSLGKEEVLNVKWANDDPNPAAQEAIKRADADAAVAALRARGVQIQADSGQADSDSEQGGGSEGPSKRLKTEASEDAYPDTDKQFEGVEKKSSEKES